MKNLQKTALGIAFSLVVSLPAFANYSEFDLKGTVDNSISVQVFDSANNLFSGNDNTTSIPAIQFGHVNTLGQKNEAHIGEGIVGVSAVNRFFSYSSDGTSGMLQPSGTLAPAGSQIIGGFFGIEMPGGAIRVQVDSMASSGSNLNVSYTTMTGTPPDLVLSNSTVPMSGAFPPPTGGAVVIKAGLSNIPIAGTGGLVSSSPIQNGVPGRLGMNIGVLALNAAAQGNLVDGAFTGRVRFTATP